MKLVKSIYFFLFTIVALSSVAQVGNRYSAEEIKAQDDYLDAQVDIYMERYDLAVKKLLKLYKEDIANSLYAFDLARTYYQLEDYPNAEKYAAIAAREDSDNLTMLKFYASLMMELERYEAAAKSYAELVIKDPQDISHIENQAQALINLGRPKEAIKVIDEWESNNFVVENLIRKKYEIYEQSNAHDKAEIELKKLVRIDPYNTRYLNNLAAFYLDQDQTDKAEEIFTKVLEIDPNNNKANTAMYKLVATEKKDGPFLRSLLPLIERQDIDPDAKIIELLPYVNQLVEKPDDELQSSLLQLTETLTLIHPEDPKSLAIRADVLQLAGRKKEAIAAYQKTLDINKKVYDVWQQLFYLLADQEEYKELGEYAYLAMDYFPNKADNYYFYGMAQNEDNNANEAMDYLQEGLMVAAGNTVQRSKILSELARASLLLENVGEAEKYVDESLDLSNSKNPYALEVKGDVLAAQGKPKEANSYWLKAREMGSTRKSLEKKLN